jgi:hypothetical protein
MVRPAIAAALLLVCVASAAAAPRPVRGGADHVAITKLLQRQTAHFNAGRWQALWLTYTPRFRRGCSYRLWRREQQALRRAIGARIKVRGIRVRVTRRRAAVSYTLLLGDRGIVVVRPQQPDLYVRIGRRWLDEGDGITTCRAGTA